MKIRLGNVTNTIFSVAPFVVVHDAHDSMITSILYLARAHHLVTTSLDSTAKFWKINASAPSDGQYLEEVKRFYSNECVYLNSKSNNILLSQEGCRMEVLAIAKISKQINENNKYKYESKIEMYQVENMALKTGSGNIYL